MLSDHNVYTELEKESALWPSGEYLCRPNKDLQQIPARVPNDIMAVLSPDSVSIRARGPVKAEANILQTRDVVCK
jgi:hypothetical protein